MTASQEIARRTDGVVTLIQDPRFVEQLKESLPENVDLARFKRVAITTIREKPELLECNENSLFAAIVRCAQDGLLPDGKEAAIVKRGQGDKAKASYMPMVTGIRKKAAEHGWTIYTAVVYANDLFSEPVVDGEKLIRHEPVRPGQERGDLVAVYAIAKHRDGRRVQTVLHPADVDERRELAQTKAVWDKWTAQMWEKSAAHDVFGQLGLAENDRAVASMLSALNVDAGDATKQLYGSDTISSGTGPASTTGRPLTAEHPEGTRQQAGSATVDAQTSSAVAEPVPGTDDEPVPAVDRPAGTNPTDDAIKAAADQAAMFIPPNGVHAAAGRSLSEILALGNDGKGWLKWALGKGTNLTPESFRIAVWSFSRVYAPDLYQAALAAQEANAA